VDSFERFIALELARDRHMYMCAASNTGPHAITLLQQVLQFGVLLAADMTAGWALKSIVQQPSVAQCPKSRRLDK
jgi:hypothetical protein